MLRWLNSLLNPGFWVGFILLFLRFCSNVQHFCSSARHLPLKQSSNCCSGRLHFQRDQKREHVNASRVTGTAVDVTRSQWAPEDVVIHSDTESALQATSVTAQVKHAESWREQEITGPGLVQTVGCKSHTNMSQSEQLLPSWSAEGDVGIWSTNKMTLFKTN